jgi:hypothetical protein
MPTQPGLIERVLPEFIASPGGTALRLFVDPSDNKAYVKNPSGIVTPLQTEIVGIVTLIGEWDASGGLFPTVPSPVKKGYEWVISVGGTIGGEVVQPGDLIIALIDNPGQLVSNWIIVENNIGYVPENVANKATDFSTINNTLYPSVKAVNDELANYEPSLGFTPENVANKATDFSTINNTLYPSVKAVSDYITGLGISSSVISEVLFTADITTVVVGTAPFASVYTKSYPVSATVVNGKTRRVRFITTYSKTATAATQNFRIKVGPNILTFTSVSMGGLAIVNDTYIFDVFINFRTLNKANILVQYQRFNSSSLLTSQTQLLNNVTWDKTIANDLTLDWAVLTGAVTHTFKITDVTSELI